MTTPPAPIPATLTAPVPSQVFDLTNVPLDTQSSFVQSVVWCFYNQLKDFPSWTQETYCWANMHFLANAQIKTSQNLWIFSMSLYFVVTELMAAVINCKKLSWLSNLFCNLYCPLLTRLNFFCAPFPISIYRRRKTLTNLATPSPQIQKYHNVFYSAPNTRRCNALHSYLLWIWLKY